MSARNKLRVEVVYALKVSGLVRRDEEWAEADKLIDAFAHELADKIRRMVHKRCVNDTDGDGDCAACARNPEALCRQYTPEDEALLRAADLIDPTKEGDRG